MSFDAVAPWYRALETIAFGNALQQCRVACLGGIQAPRHALIVGEGNGRFLCELLRAHPRVQVDCVDSSERMLQLARKRVQSEMPDRTDQVRFLHRDITTWLPAENAYDLLVTHFLLDCFPVAELVGVIRKLALAATVDAAWLLADFRLPAQGFARLHAKVWLVAMYQFFRLTAGIKATELVDPTPHMQGEAFFLAHQHVSRNGMMKSVLWRRNL
ncbi:MAG TPA: class I SAM-dependent methyltransferase [Chthoniobacterales bacterium]